MSLPLQKAIGKLIFYWPVHSDTLSVSHVGVPDILLKGTQNSEVPYDGCHVSLFVCLVYFVTEALQSVKPMNRAIAC